MRTLVLLLGSLALAAYALWDAGQLNWLCDDAYISFRYARNLVEGHGLVFNPGERVEGYTNFLWTLLAAAGLRLGLAPEATSPLLGLAALAGLLALMFRTSTTMARDLVLPRPWLSLGLAGVALHAQHRIWATSGLETGLFTLLVTATVVAAIEARTDRSWLGVGLWGSLATLTRPEGALVYGLAILSGLLGPRTGRVGRLVRATLPGVVLLAPWLFWKLSYYGDWLPNTFFAKVSEEPRWAEGAAYAWLYFGTYLGLVPGLVVVALWPLRTRAGGTGWGGVRAPWLIAALVSGWLLHVLRVGGDFMFARFLLPITPVLLLALERGLALVPGGLRWPCVAAVLVGVGLVKPPDGLFELEGIDGVVEERSWYPDTAQAEAARQGEVLRRALEGSDTRVVFYGTQAMLMYYGEVPYALEGHVGLTDRELARMDPPKGTRIGHGKKATLEYLRTRQVDLLFDFRLQVPSTNLTRIDFGKGVGGRLITYRRATAARLRARGALFVDFEGFLDQYVANLEAMPDEKVAREYAQFRTYYFDHNEDPAREALFQKRLEAGE